MHHACGKVHKMKEKFVLVFFDDEKADEYERRAAMMAEEGEEVEYHAGEKVIARGDGEVEDGQKADQ